MAGEVPISPFVLSDLGEALRRHWLTAAVVAAMIIAPGLYWIRGEVPVYRADATIRLRDVQSEMTGGLVGGGVGELTRGIDPVKSQIEVLASRAVALQVIDSCPELRLTAVHFPLTAIDDLRVAPEIVADSIRFSFGPVMVRAIGTRGSASALYGNALELDGVRMVVGSRPAETGLLHVHGVESAVDRLMDNLQVRSREQTDVVDVTYFDTERHRAQRVVNRVVSVFQLFNAAAAKQQSIRRRQFLEGQLRYNDSVLNAARVELSLFRGRQRAYSTKLRLSSEQASLMQLQVQQESLAADRRIYRDLLDQLQSSKAGPDDGQVGAIMTAPGISGNPVVTELYQQLSRYQATRDSLTTGRFGRPESNPQVQQLDVLIRSAQAKLVGAVRSYIGSLDARIASMARLRSQSSSGFPELSSTEEEEGRLEEGVEAARVTVGQLRGEYEKARLAEAVEVGQVEIVSLATLPRGPIGVGPLRKTILLVLVGFGFGIGLALIRERLNRSVRKSGQVEQLLNVSELAVIPQVVMRRQRILLPRTANGGRPRLPGTKPGNGRITKTPPLGDGLVVASNVHSTAAEAYRLLRTNLLFSLPNGPMRSVLVTSPAPGDGKTTVAANLAIAFAQQGMSVLLVDADLRRGRAHQMFAVPRAPGLSEILSGKIALSDAIRSTSISGLSIVATGCLPDDPNELVGGRVMRAMLAEAARVHAVVIIDTPPVLAASDAAVLASICDATVLVVRAGRTHEEEAQVSLGRLTSVGGNVVGAVLNDPEANVRVGAGYYYYSEYYGKQEEKG